MLEWNVAAYHVVEQDSEHPPLRRTVVVRRVKNPLGRAVYSRPADAGVGGVFEYGARAKIDQREVACFRIDENVLILYVAVHDAGFVATNPDTDHLAKYRPGPA